jgi:hypothetical protein
VKSKTTIDSDSSDSETSEKIKKEPETKVKIEDAKSIESANEDRVNKYDREPKKEHKGKNNFSFGPVRVFQFFSFLKLI